MSQKAIEVGVTSLACLYARFSCDKSSPASILDQMRKVLHKARDEDRFIPWEFVFADYSVSGLQANRNGYTNCKAQIESVHHSVNTIYIDDFTRASRDSVEWWKLAARCKRHSKRMIGASDGFDLGSPQSEIMITVYGLVSNLLIRGIREKVARGMEGAAGRGTVIGRLPLGFTRKTIRDESGDVVLQPDGSPVFQPAIDPESREIVRLIFDLFIEKRWSAHRIHKHFNLNEIGSWDRWSEAGIKQILSNPANIGVFIWNRTRREFDFEDEKWVKIPNPKSEWVIRYDKSLAIVSMEQWRAARRLRASRKRRKDDSRTPLSRNQQCATTLFSGTLNCGYCGRELTLCRSAGKYKNMFCLNGRSAISGCRLSTTKSTRIIEERILAYIRDSVLTEGEIEQLVSKANDYLESLSCRPHIPVASLKAKVTRRTKSIDKLVRLIEDLPETDSAVRETYEKRIGQLHAEVTELRGELREANASNVKPPPKLSVVTMASYLDDLRAVLNQEIPAAAEAIRQLTGPISIRQEKIEGRKRGARWIATFSPDLLGFLRRVTQEKDYPDSITLEFLSKRIWITPESVDVVVDDLPRYELIADRAAQMADDGVSTETTARALHTSWATVQDALVFKRTGKRPAPKPTGKKTRKRKGPPKYQSIASEVAKRRDKEKQTFACIAEDLGVSESTATRAYDYLHQESLEKAACAGETPNRGRWRHIAAEKIDEMRRLLNEGKMTVAKIADEVGVSPQTVYRERAVIEDDG
jgi:DNA invertase Pin-like site-specific DNA recombinase